MTVAAWMDFTLYFNRFLVEKQHVQNITIVSYEKDYISTWADRHLPFIAEASTGSAPDMDED